MLGCDQPNFASFLRLPNGRGSGKAYWIGSTEHTSRKHLRISIVSGGQSDSLHYFFFREILSTRLRTQALN